MITAITLDNPFAIRVTETNMPTCAEDEVLVQVKYVGLCGTDLSSYRGKMPLVSYPRIPGHEVSGTIVDTGSRVPASFQKGLSVTLNPYTSCGQCPACRQQRFNTCQWNQTLGVQRDGALQQYLAVPYTKVLISSLTQEILVFTEPLSVGYHACSRAQITPGDSVIVIGCGMIGIGVILSALDKGTRVIALDTDDKKLQLVSRLGNVETVNPDQEDPITRTLALTQQEGAAVVIEAVGSPLTYQWALEMASYAGRVVCIGYSADPVALPTSLIVRKELTVLGSRNVLNEFGPVLERLESGQWPVAQLISGIYPLEAAPQAFAYWHEHPREIIKLLIQVN